LLFLVAYGDENRIFARDSSYDFGKYGSVDLYRNCRSETRLGAGYYKVFAGVV
jgi:hypothetical protein